MENSDVPRIERKSEGGFNIVFQDTKQCMHTLSSGTNIFQKLSHKDILESEESEIMESLYATVENYSPLTINVATSVRGDSDPFYIQSKNLYYYQTDVNRRDLTEKEKEPYQDSFIQAPDSLNEISLPPLDKFLNPLDSVQLCTNVQHDCISAISEKMSERIERMKWVKVKQRALGGNERNLPPAWKDKDSGEIARHRYDANRQSWRDMFGLSYDEFFISRTYDVYDNIRFKRRNIVNTDIIDESSGENFCEYCGCIDDKDRLLYIEDRRGSDKRVCRDCGERESVFSKSDVIKALNRRASQHGGQTCLNDDMSE